MSGHDDEFVPEVLDALTLGLPGVGTPSTDLRQRLLQRAGGPDRFLPFLDRMMELFDLPESGAQAQLAFIDQPDAWEDMLPGIRYRDFEGGPAVGEAHGGLVRLAPGVSFPRHTHVGEERVLVLQGELEDEHGHRYRAGDLIVSADQSSHELQVVSNNEVVYAALVIALQFGDDDALEDDDDFGDDL